MATLIMTKGLPESGKTTWAKQYMQENPNTIRVNKNDLRAMLHGGNWSQGREAFVISARNWLVSQGLLQGHDVIVDDTNLNPIHEKVLRKIAIKHEADFVVQIFS